MCRCSPAIVPAERPPRVAPQREVVDSLRMHRCLQWLCSQFAVGSKIIAEEGVGALYRGLSAGLLRQATYTTARLGIYQFISDELAKRHDGKVPITVL